MPFQNSTTRFTALSGGRCAGQQGSRYDHISLSAPPELEKRDFQEMVASIFKVRIR